MREQREPARVLLRAVRLGMQPPPALADEEEPVPAGGEVETARVMVREGGRGGACPRRVRGPSCSC